MLASQLIVELDRWALHGTYRRLGELPSAPVTRLRPERTSALIGLSIDAAEQRESSSGSASTSRTTVDRHGAHLARPRRHARDRSDRGGCAHPRLDERAVHAAPAAGDVRPAQPGAAPATAASRTCWSAAASPRPTPGVSSPGPGPGGARLPEPLSARPRDPAHDARRAGWSRGRATTSTPGTRRSRSSRSRASTFRRASSFPTSAGASGHREGGYFAAKGAVEALHEALELESAFERTREPFLATPARAARVGGGLGRRAPSASCSRASGVSSSWISQTLFAHVPERILYEDVVTLPGAAPGSRVRRAEEVPAGAARRGGARRGGRRAPRGARLRRLPRRSDADGRSPLRSGSRSSRPSGRSPTRTRRCCGSGS